MRYVSQIYLKQSSSNMFWHQLSVKRGLESIPSNKAFSKSAGIKALRETTPRFLHDSESKSLSKNNKRHIPTRSWERVLVGRTQLPAGPSKIGTRGPRPAAAAPQLQSSGQPAWWPSAWETAHTAPDLNKQCQSWLIFYLHFSDSERLNI